MNKILKIACVLSGILIISYGIYSIYDLITTKIAEEKAQALALEQQKDYDQLVEFATKYHEEITEVSEVLWTKSSPITFEIVFSMVGYNSRQSDGVLYNYKMYEDGTVIEMYYEHYGADDVKDRIDLGIKKITEKLYVSKWIPPYV